MERPIRHLWPLLVVGVAACGPSSSTSTPTSQPPVPVTAPTAPAPRPVIGTLNDASKDEADGLTIRYTGTAVSLADLPMVAAALGLPVSGKADFSIDVIVPKTKGVPDYTKATGSIELSCAKCRIGDDVAKLQLTAKNTRSAAFAGEGIAFGHIDVDSFEARLSIAGGKLETSAWKLASPDLEMQAQVSVTFARELDRSSLDGCVRFKPTSALEKRDPKTHAVLLLTGAQVGADGFFQIQLDGTVGQRRKLPRDCTASI